MLRSQQTCFPPCATNTALSPRLMQMFGSNASACQMNSDGVFITRLHTALHTHAVSQNQQTAFSPNLPLPSTEIDLAPRSDCSRGSGGERGPALCKSSGAAFLTSAAETYHLVHGHEAGIQGDDSEENLEGGGEKTQIDLSEILQQQWHDELFTGRSVKRQYIKNFYSVSRG